MARPTPLSGFPEWLPGQRIVEQRVIDTLRNTFELWGYAPLETRAVEPLGELLRKGEIDKEVYLLRRLHAEPGEDEATDASRRLGLHYDLTVPFARYVLEHAGKLSFPFRRYQIQKVWRGERPQEGRYREFLQADIDVVGQAELPFHHDVEVAQVMAEALSALPLPPMTLQLNNRRLIQGFYRGLGVGDAAAVMRVVDKLDKIGPDAAAGQLLEQAGLSGTQARATLALADIVTPDLSFVERVRGLGVSDPLLEQGLAELSQVLEGVAEVGSNRIGVTADLRIARGLDYYTGTVYETRLHGAEQLGSICSGGRYESLATDGAQSYPGVGISFGVTRALGPLFARGELGASRQVPSCVLVAVVDEAGRARSRGVAAALRARGIAAEVAPKADKFGKQIRYADRRGIPYVWFPGADEPAEGPDHGAQASTDDLAGEVKDIRSGEQVPARAAEWVPDAADLRPDVVSGTPDQGT